MASAEVEAPTVTASGSVGGGGKVRWLSTASIKSLTAILMIINIVFTLIAWALMINFLDGITPNGNGKFFLFSTICPWVVFVILFILLITGVAAKLKVPWGLIMFIFCALFALLALVSSCILAADLNCPRGCDKYKASLAFGFLSCFGMALQAVFHFREWKRS